MEYEISQVVTTVVVLCLFLWRISYGTNNGLFAEAAGFVAVIASLAAVYYITKIMGDAITSNFGQIFPKIGYLVVAFIIYRLMTALGNALRGIKEVPILGGLDRVLGAVLGAAEAWLIIYIIEYVTGYSIMQPVIATFTGLFQDIRGMIEKTL